MAKVVDLRGKVMGGGDKRSKITKIARHHSATTSGDVYAFQNHWKILGWKTGGYHEIILRDGTVQLCYNSNVVTNGVYGHNQNTYHICLVGNSSFTDAQEKAFVERAKYNLNRFGLKVSDVLGHREFSGASTTCPGINMDTVRSRLSGSSSKNAAVPKKSTEDAYIRDIQQFVVDYGFSIAIDSIAGPLTKKALVKVLQSELNKQFGAGLAVDGIPGPKTYAALVTVRKGAKGNITKVLQALLYISGHNPGKLDGDFGGGTEKAVRSYQKAKGLSVDGTPGKATWTKLIA